jgi:protein-S-isoprenylcysteine O-methyltransferase Ste14
MRAGIRARLQLTRLLGFVVVVLVLSSASYWSLNGPSLVADGLFLGGALLAVAGFGGRLWALAHIGGRKKRLLVRSGPYSLCRHPLYMCSLVGGLGLVMCTGRLSVVVLYLAASWLLVPLTIRTEEAYLQERFREYADYRRAVPALLPHWRRLRSGQAADEGAADPRDVEDPLPVDRWAVWRGLAETVASLSPVLLLAVLQRAQDAGAMPVLFVLP